MDIPPAAFGLVGEPGEIRGGVSGVFRYGDVVVKPVTDHAEAEWTQATFAALTPSAEVRWARPIAATDGRWVVDGWIANEFVPDLSLVAPNWAAVLEFGARFHASTREITPPDAMLRARDHRWARGERHAFDEETVELSDHAAAIDAQLATWCDRDPNPPQVVHVDLANNVFVDLDGVPVVLDISPGFRTPAYCAAVVIADALVWTGADVRIIDLLGPPSRARPILARALRFRITTDHLAHSERGDLAAPNYLDRYRNVITAMSERAPIDL